MPSIQTQLWKMRIAGLGKLLQTAPKWLFALLDRSTLWRSQVLEDLHTLWDVAPYATELGDPREHVRDWLQAIHDLSLIHISEPTRLALI
eukprot:6421218-Alexandrium_andersonii.AAC.1